MISSGRPNLLVQSAPAQWTFSTIVLALGLAVAIGCGRSRIGNDSIEPVDRHQVTGKGGESAEDSAAEAINLVQNHLQEEEYEYAYDALLAAMRLNPSDPAVFDTTLTFVQRTGEREDDVSLLAHDLYLRADGLIPFQPLERLVESRDRYLEASGIFDIPEPSPPDPFAVFPEQLEAASNSELPVTVRSNLVQQLRSELDSLAVQAATEQLYPLPESFWDLWDEQRRKLDEAEMDLLSAMYRDEFVGAFEKWNQETNVLLEQSENAQASGLERLDREFEGLIERGHQLYRDNTPYLEAGVETATNREIYLKRRLERLNRSQRWGYNRFALHNIEDVKNSGEPSLTKLKRLAKIDEDRLSPYVQQQWQALWNEEFEECNEDEKVEAVKARVIGRFDQ